MKGAQNLVSGTFIGLSGNSASYTESPDEDLPGASTHP